MWTYHQATGVIMREGGIIGAGYAGHGAGVNNPDLQDVPFVGPLPRGQYRIGPVHMPVDHLGPCALPLYPDPANNMFGRFGFFIHGDLPIGQRSYRQASAGCIVLDLLARQIIDHSGDIHLVVVA